MTEAERIVEVLNDPKRATGLAPHTIRGRGRTAEEAWSKFWDELGFLAASLPASGLQNNKIFFRRLPELFRARELDSREEVFVVRAWFSIAYGVGRGYELLPL